ncbi:AzlC family ABC transporter permease [Undibacter mobilis]|uniref:Branched-chain amino acid ABC transporter permease n=1 Tax=Undibacter mobilis TaxID=2292256 RepID=A0A371BD21_9BRAD|nr:AzlC family ABC transporter permease [Undibacter mobilis]RDV05515.1 branched-chain amino acid ABC transporter permease [Undibacter mobilis]
MLMPDLRSFPTSSAAFLGGVKRALTSVFFPVMAGTYIGLGALAHDYGLSAWWLTASTLFVWAGPAQVILISGIGTGSALIEVAIAVSLSGIRLFPMVVALLPLLRTRATRTIDLVLPAHFTSVSMWIESLHTLPGIAAENRLAYCNGLSVAYISVAATSGLVGFFLAAGLPPLFAAALLFITPLSFLISTARSAVTLLDRVALGLGIVFGSSLAALNVEFDLMWSGVGGGTLAYVVHRVLKARGEARV